MNFTNIRRTTALALLVLLLVGIPCLGLNIKGWGHRDLDEWIHAFVLGQSVLLMAWAVYGPGSLFVRMPLAVAWGLVVGILLATLNLISIQGRASIAAGTILVLTGTFGPLLIFALHRRSTRAAMVIGTPSSHDVARPSHQLSLRMLMIVTAAFAVTGAIARSAVTVPADPFGNEHDILVLHAWLGFFPCLIAAPALLVVFRPSRKTALACCCFFVCVAFVEPLLLALLAPYFFRDTSFLANVTTWSYFQAVWTESTTYHGQAVAAVIIYAILARAAGMRMVFPDQSNDKNPNPSGLPVTDAGRVQD